jgi:hypothetical protein
MRVMMARYFFTTILPPIPQEAVTESAQSQIRVSMKSFLNGERKNKLTAWYSDPIDPQPLGIKG